MNFPRKIVNAFGYDVLKIKKYHPTIESHLKILFKALAIDLVIDVGANNGGYGRMLRRMGYKGHVLSFEPVRSCYDELKKFTDRDEKWSSFDCALGPKEAELTINVPKSSDFASFLNVTQSARSLWAEDFASVGTEKVRVKRLDDVFEGIVQSINGWSNIFLKLDTQGYDLEVLRGAEDILKRVAGLQSEISVVPIYENMPDYIESLSCFKKGGFEVTGMYPVSRNMETLVVVEFDCVMTRKSEARSRVRRGQSQ